jgi:hypothetical protein
LRRAILPCFFAVSAFLEPANVSQSLESDGNQLDSRMFKCTRDLFCGARGYVIREFRSSETVCARFLSENKPSSGQSPKMMLKSVMAKADLNKKSGESSWLAVSKLG